MSRCQHCNKLTHSEHLYVECSQEDYPKVLELTSLVDWQPRYQYDDIYADPEEYGRLKCGDIYIHFRIKSETK